MMSARQPALALCITFLTSLFISSCSISNRWVNEDAEGIVPESFFSTIKRNRTEKAWVLDNIGEPQSSVIGPNNEEIVTYNFKRTQYRAASLFIVFRYDSSTQDMEYYHLMYCDGVVKKAWWDKFQDVQVTRLTRRSKCGQNKMSAIKTKQTSEPDQSKSDHAMVVSANINEKNSVDSMKSRMHSVEPAIDRDVDALSVETITLEQRAQE